MMKVVFTLEDQVDEAVIKDALEKAGIKHVMRTFVDSAYDGIFIAQRGYGEVLVEEGDEAKTKEIIAEVTTKMEE